MRRVVFAVAALLTVATSSLLATRSLAEDVETVGAELPWYRKLSNAIVGTPGEGNAEESDLNGTENEGEERPREGYGPSEVRNFWSDFAKGKKRPFTTRPRQILPLELLKSDKRPSEFAFYEHPRPYDITLVVYRNGGNNTKEDALPVMLKVNVVLDDIAYVMLRAGVKLGMFPTDCTEYSHGNGKRPRRPAGFPFYAPVNDRLEPDPKCGLSTWSFFSRFHDSLGHRVSTLFGLRDRDVVTLVPPGDHFFWPGGYIGRRLVLDDVRLPGPEAEPIVIETVMLQPRMFFIPKFLTDEEADALVAASESNLKQSLGFRGKEAVVTERRTSTQHWLNCRDGPSVVCDLDKRIAKILRIPHRHIEHHTDALQVVHYSEGQFYNTHTDWFDPTSAPDVPALRLGYNRMITVLTFNDFFLFFLLFSLFVFPFFFFVSAVFLFE